MRLPSNNGNRIKYYHLILKLQLDSSVQTISSRMIFIENEQGEKVATATVYPDKSNDDIGWLQWVAVRKKYQGNGLSKPLISKALSLFQKLGYKEVRLSTQTNTWLAVKG